MLAHLLSWFLRRPLPAMKGLLPATCHGEFAIRRVTGDHRASADGGLCTDAHRRDQRTVGADEPAIPDVRNDLVDAVVVAGDRAGADVHATADLAVPEVAEMVGLAAFA